MSQDHRPQATRPTLIPTTNAATVSNPPRCLAARDTRPPVRRLLEPVLLSPDHPVLPWASVPEIVDAADPVEPLARQVAASVTIAIVEALAGKRSLVQLERWLEPDLISLLEHLCRSRVGWGLRLRSIRLQSPTPGVVEVTAHLHQHGAARAAALRLARRESGWVGTNLEIALRPSVVNRA
ncbi:MAG: Rv3235 family protein [Propionicimonas sp.]